MGQAQHSARRRDSFVSSACRFLWLTMGTKEGSKISPRTCVSVRGGWGAKAWHRVYNRQPEHCYQNGNVPLSMSVSLLAIVSLTALL